MRLAVFFFGGGGLHKIRLKSGLNSAHFAAFSVCKENHLYYRFKVLFNQRRAGGGLIGKLQNYAELDVGRCSIDFGVLENLYVDAEIVFLSRTDT